jgi:protein SCO1/2
MALLLGGTAVVACSSDAVPPTPPPSLGIVQNRTVPDITLVDQHGTATPLAAFRGRTVLLAPIWTLSGDTSQLTTANLLEVQHAVDRAGMGNRVAVVEYSVDPGRDTPARLTAYASRTGATWTLLTGTPSAVSALDSFLYVQAAQVAEGDPPRTDWLTGAPLTYEVDPSDGYVVIDPSGRLRFATAAEPAVPGHAVPAGIGRLLDDQGLEDLNDPSIEGQTWTVAQVLSVVGWVTGRSIPLPAG